MTSDVRRSGPALEVLHATLADPLPIRRMLELHQHDLSDTWDQDLYGDYGHALERHGQPRRFTSDAGSR